MLLASTEHSISPPQHGGNLDLAIAQYGGHAEDWLDLSTGISPWSYPLPKIDATLWHQLPTEPSTLRQAAADYYGCAFKRVVVTPGSQLAIRLLPGLLPHPSSVAIPLTGYQEHQYAWQRAGHRIYCYQDISGLNSLIANQQVAHAVVINPNNPTTQSLNNTELRQVATALSGVLLIDEAFADTAPSSMTDQLEAIENLLILRSPGKFFGLAGARVGFLLSCHPLANQLKTLLMPWSLSAPACFVVESALRDRQWQAVQRHRIQQAREGLEQQLSRVIDHGDTALDLRAEALFCSVFGAAQPLRDLHHALAKRKIWTRLNAPQEPVPWLRIGLPGPAQSRFAAVLNDVVKQ